MGSLRGLCMYMLYRRLPCLNPHASFCCGVVFRQPDIPTDIPTALIYELLSDGRQ